MAPSEQDSVSEEYLAREQARQLRLRLGLRWFAAVLLIAALVGMMIGRLLNGTPPLPDVLLGPVQLLEVRSQALDDGLELRLLFDRHSSSQLQQVDGVQQITLPEVNVHAVPRAGRESGIGWRLLVRGQQAQLLLLGLTQAPEVKLSSEYVDGRWCLIVRATRVADRP